MRTLEIYLNTNAEHKYSLIEQYKLEIKHDATLPFSGDIAKRLMESILLAGGYNGRVNIKCVVKYEYVDDAVMYFEYFVKDMDGEVEFIRSLETLEEKEK